MNTRAAVAATRPNAILAHHYAEEAEALASCPVLQALAAELPPELNIERYGFAFQLNNEYTLRGGKHLKSIGGPLWALRALKAQAPELYRYTTTRED